MTFKTEFARVTRSLWGLKPEAQTVVYKGEEIEEISLLNRITEDGWKLLSITALATDVLGGTNEIVIRYYLGKD